ncbi:hypothetical protein KC19_2G215700 [Ceratodon purpureus]|uniref:Uncharacterized protein n=1 Tax=Ceratodon purpureus TaxID=3225 RepID=A0A8T0IYX3_CERPU|nr:hypothetical protein KC19_2G215700 [Ceratodon purpureus]
MRNDENFLWMQLSKCRITDKHTRKTYSFSYFLFEDCRRRPYNDLLNLAYKRLSWT